MTNRPLPRAPRTRYLTVAQLSERWGYSPTWIRARIHAQELTAEVWTVGRRPSFRITFEAAAEFERRFRRRSDRDEW